jgi:hypothetical protein
MVGMFRVAGAIRERRRRDFVEIMLAVLCASVKHDDARIRIETCNGWLGA